MNLYFATSRGPLTASRLGKVLRDVVDDRFGDHLLVQQDPSAEHYFSMSDPALAGAPRGYLYRVEAWLETSRKVGFRDGRSEFAHWVKMVLQEEVAHRLGGRCSDESSAQAWQPTKGRFPTFRAYLEEVNAELPREINRRLLAALPPSLRVFGT